MAATTRGTIVCLGCAESEFKKVETVDQICKCKYEIVESFIHYSKQLNLSNSVPFTITGKLLFIYEADWKPYGRVRYVVKYEA